MSSAIFGSRLSIMRRSLIRHASDVWDLCRDEIEGLKEQLYTRVNGSARQNVDQSYRAMEQIYAGLNSQEYITAEQPDTFKQLVDRLNDSLKSILLAYIQTNDISYSDDNVEELTEVFYRSVERRLSRRRLCCYPAITKLLRFIRNCEEHEHIHRPEDLITGSRSFGNVYMLVSIFILSLYAYVEILRFWVEVPET